MKVAVAAGVEIDLATPDEIKQIVHGSRRQIIVRKPKGSAIVPTPTANTVVDLGSPGAGRQWDVKHIMVSGPDPLVTTAGIALVCVGKANTIIDPLDVWTALASIPGDFSFGGYQCTVVGFERLYIIFTGVAAATNVIAHAQVVDEPERVLTIGSSGSGV